MKRLKLATAAIIIPISLLTSGCTALVVGAAAATGYVAYENGYRVRSPVTKNRSKKSASSN